MPLITGRSFGQERPPLTDLLKNILLRYPDGGQILKELIQNADDAGATEVRFLYDATNHGTSSLFSPGLAPFQGPALYCYNSAKFTEQDWDGLQRLMRSNKKDNPLKVGRFGIGFNSVYHITDLPSIVSGDTVAFLDPHEKYFVRGQPGQAFSMSDPLLEENHDQFAPFHEIFGCRLDQGNNFEGTLFRFPLRTAPSELSKKIYTKQMVTSLFESFQTESSIILHFLKNVEYIGLYTRENRGSISCIYNVKISDSCREDVRAKRNELTTNITSNWDYSPCSVFYTLEVEEQRGTNAAVKTRKWYMASQVGTDERRLIDLAQELQLLPWIGIAFPVETGETAIHRGRIFCFLPLPPDADCRSGLPIQMNGYFGLTDNRRSLKWPGPDCQNDDTAEWNKLLLRTLGSRVYAYLIEKMTQAVAIQSVQPSEMLAHVNMVYSAIPRARDVKEDWRCFLEPFFIEVLQQNIFCTTAGGHARWRALDEVIFDRMQESEETNEAVYSALLRSVEPVVRVPENILEMIDNYLRKSGSKTIRKIEPSLVRDVLRKSRKWYGMSTEEKLLLLEYILDGCNGHDLSGILLLPLQNGEFCVFKKVETGTSEVFITDGHHNKALLPNAHHRLLREDIPSSLTRKLLQLTSIDHGYHWPTQLRRLTKEDVLQLLWENFPDEWARDKSPGAQVVSWYPGTTSHPPETWLELIWNWIRQQFRTDDLEMLNGMPLIPLPSRSGGLLGTISSYFHTPGKVLGKLSRDSKIIFASFPGHISSLTSSLRQFLLACGCHVVEEVPSYIRHEQIFCYVAPPTSQGLLRVLMAAGRQNVVQRLASTSDGTKTELRSWFSNDLTLSADQKLFILALPIFKSVDGGHFLSCVNNHVMSLVAPPNFSLPANTQIVDQKKIISSSHEASLTLLKKLGMNIGNTASILMNRLDSYLSSTTYGDQEKNKLMLWILEQMEVLAQGNDLFTGFLCGLSFVPTTGGARKAPCELYDHRDEVLRQLLLDNPHVFPAQDFIDALEKRKSNLEVRCKNNLTAQNVFDIVTMASSSPANSVKKGHALLSLLNERPSLLTGTLSYGSSLRDKLLEISWVPRICHPPHNYPSFMPWYDGGSLCKPSTMCPSSMALLVGATLPLFNENYVKQPVQDAFYVSKTNNISHVVKQLRLAIDSWNKQSNKPSGMELANFQELLKSIYRECFKNPTLDIVQQFLDETFEWVWHGKGFTSPRKVALCSSFPADIPLYPHLFLLPQDFQDLKDFLLRFGVKEKFKDEDLFTVLSSIKTAHDNMTGDVTLVTKDLNCCRAILEWLVRDSRALSDECRSKLLIPVHTTSERLRLEPCDNCTYCDRDFLRQGGSESNVTANYHLIHKCIPDKLASSLGVPQLSSCLSGAIPLGYEIEEAGQHEPLTTRLRNILDEYKEGLAIFKELIQNADDAGASKVCFVVDWRDTPGERLLSPEMAKCQGPALWAYNNAVFSKRDFKNINLLAGGTKKEDLDKIGRFGLGFNAVYHLTDVPSFISADHFVAFDPNMNHIRGILGRKSDTGLKINLVNSNDVFSHFPDQFRPYNDLFGCNTKSPSPGTFPYKGTLFRFPLRTPEQAIHSEISKRPCSRDDLCHMLESLKASASSLLLFAQNVKQVRVFEINKNSDPTSALGQPIMSISKDLEEILHSNSTDGKGTFLRNVSNWWRERGGEEGPHRTELLKISVVVKESNLTNTTASEKFQETWLVNSWSGQDRSVRLAASDKGKSNGLLPISGAAVKLEKPKDPHCNNVKIESVSGEVFCFLPLSFTSGLPVHVNGYFAVLSNRRGIWEEGVGDHETMMPFEAKWNAALMDDALVRAYLQLLAVVKSYADKQYVFHSLWPDPSRVTHPTAWKPFINAFFGKIINERLPFFHCNKAWRPLQDCFILDSKLSKVEHCLSIMNILGINVLSIPQCFLEGFQSSGNAEIIKQQTLTEERFLRQHFFPNVAKVPTVIRNSIICHVLQLRLNSQHDFDDLFDLYPCFSCSNDGKTLRRPRDMVHPKGKVAGLFSDQEKRFPVEENILTKERAMMLEDLGMVVDHLTWDQVCERAEWITSRGPMEQPRAILLVNYLVGYLEDPSFPEPTNVHKHRLRAAKILPFLEKPKEYPISWKGSTVPPKSLFSANELFSDKWKHLVGANELILGESSFVSGSLRKLKSVLGLNAKQPKIQVVLTQLDNIIGHVNSTSKVGDAVKHICAAIYNHFETISREKKATDAKRILVQELARRPWVLVKDKMINSSFVAKSCLKDGSPYLYSLPGGYSQRYPNLVQFCGIKQQFTVEDFLEAIEKFRSDAIDRELSKQQLSVLLHFLEELTKDWDSPCLDNIFPLPDKDGILRNGADLVINDKPWFEPDCSIRYVHDSFPGKLAYLCGAKPLIEDDVSRSSEPIGQPFGQHESLTDRLKGILKSYPADEGILKELIQNADDAKANEIHFVYDPRTHNSKHVFNENWDELCGPAICVYNDQPFSKEDIEGIQNLGIGSKVDDPMKTGQYGIGFNAVYHFTDCPYFLSDDQVLCISDPHKRYVPGASDKHPGRLFSKLDDRFRRNFEDVFSGFLSEFFNLEGGTMFRFPIRSLDGFQSKVSSERFTGAGIHRLLSTFKVVARETLLFLNNIKTISISEIKNGKLETYSVSCSVPNDETRRNFAQKIFHFKKTPTEKIPWHIIDYVMDVSDNTGVKSTWLICQSLGSKKLPPDDEHVPNGVQWGLLPRAGVAACLKNTISHSHRAFCFLPLPVFINLPIHVNGHFALDPARRDLWHATNESDERTAWNEFIKRRVVAPTYACLIEEARRHIPGIVDQEFDSEHSAQSGLRWYHNLFPSVTDRDNWTTVSKALYFFLSIQATRVLPVVQSVPKPLAFMSLLRSPLKEPPPPPKTMPVAWCSVAEVFFKDNEDDALVKTFLDVGLPILSHTPSKVFRGFQSCKKAIEVSPVVVTDFLRTKSPLKDNLPALVKDTVLVNHSVVASLVEYCSEDKALKHEALKDKASQVKAFFSNIQGLPLLLTQDAVLRIFGAHPPVYCTDFFDLLPSKPELFLHRYMKHIFQSHLKECLGLVKEFDIRQLSQFRESIFPMSWQGSAVHYPWNATDGEQVPTSEWVKKLWKFIDDVSSSKEAKDNLEHILDDIKSWPIIPSIQGCLVPVSMSKTVLNQKFSITSETPLDGKRRILLSKAACPQLSSSLMPRRSTPSGSTLVLNHYLAKIQSPKEVLGLLDYTFDQNNNTGGDFSHEEILELLMFFQTDATNLDRELLKRLPFYITVDGKYISFSGSRTLYELPDGVPLYASALLSDLDQCVFLRSRPQLQKLYQHIGINNITIVDFYHSIVLKYYKHLSSEDRYHHLMFIREDLLPRLPPQKLEYNVLVNTLMELPFIHTESGTLHRANEFYDIHNKVFKAFEPKESFPPEPFDTDDWNMFLHKVGLVTVVTEEKFLKYARFLAGEILEHNSLIQGQINEMSELLVSCLFARNSGLHETKFLEKVSRIKFVSAVTIDKSLLSIHPLYEGMSENNNFHYIQFNGSVISTHKKLVWSTASVLSLSAQPVGANDAYLIKHLHIHTKPPHEAVIEHIKNIAKRFDATKGKQISDNCKFTLSWVMRDLYEYLKRCCPCGDNPNSACSTECKMACDSLRDVPFILVSESTLVRGKQLVFAVVRKILEPYIFVVSRDIAHCQHFLKQLGAQEKPTPLQYSTVLLALKESCGDKGMHPGEKGTAQAAVRGLFNSLHQKKFDESQSLASIQTLYLPTVNCKLKSSTGLLVNDCMEQKERLKEYWSRLLYDFSEKDKKRADELVDLLPVHLKLEKLSSQVESQLSPACVDQVCILDNDPGGCPFIFRYRQLMCSEEFSDALVRLYKYQETISRVKEDDERKLKTMERCLTLSCMQSIETRLVSVVNGDPLQGTMKEDNCFFQNDHGRFKILLKHGEKESSVLHGSLASFIAKMTGCLVGEENWRYVMMIFDAKEPGMISAVLDEAKIPKSITNSWQEPNPGDVIPNHFHYLLKSDLGYLLREDDLVGYDIQEEDVNQEAIYVYAKIIKQTNEGEGEFKFTSKYLIDIGQDEPIEVTKSRLYKFDREGTRRPQKKEGIEGAMVVYEGDQDTERTSEEPVKPTDLEDAKREVAEALKEIWKLPESERSSAIRRLIKRWHPDKNLDHKEFATQVSQFLQNEVERLRNGGTPGYREPGSEPDRSPNRNDGNPPRSQWDFDFGGFAEAFGRRARRDRERYDRWRHRSDAPDSEPTTEPANENEARRWLRQARVDLEAAKYLFESGNITFYGITCFHCHQTAEKCLKALLFAKGRIEKRDLDEHEVMLLAYRVARLDDRLRQLPELVKQLNGYYVKTRYPEYKRLFQDATIPAEQFTARDADSAVTKAKNIYELIKNILGV